MSKTKLYIDCQLFQTEVRDRGMGRYALSLILSLYAADDFEYVLLFSSHLPENKEVVKALTGGRHDVRSVNLDLKTTQDTPIAEASQYNKKVLNQFIATESNRKDEFFLIPCLFQEPTVCVFPDDVKTSLIYYDAIPLLYYSRYRSAINYESYLYRYKTVYQAELIFTISQTIADDLALYLGLASDDSRKIINIDGACNESMFTKLKKPSSVTAKQKYILLPSSSDIRKNNHIAVKAFEQVRELTQKDYKLVITSTFTEGQRDQLRQLSSNIIFTGNITEEELSWLYENAEIVLFASEYEGLGLPVLEAVKADKRVACSGISVFREISEEAFYYFDPLDVQEVAFALSEAIGGADWQRKSSYYKGINQKYQWSRTSSIVAQTFKGKSQVTTNVHKKPRLAVCAPVPDGYSAIGKVVQELHDCTSKYFDVDYYFENRKDKDPISVRPDFVSTLANCFSIEAFNAQTYHQYDAVLYHIGNSEYHFRTILNALYLPGIVIFHDTVLKEAFGEMVRLNYMAPERLQIEAEIDSLDASPKMKSEFITSLANNQLATITHSKYASDALKWVLREGATRNYRAQLPVVAPERSVLTQKRKKVHIGLGGVLTSNKGLDTIKALALDEVIAKDVVIHVFGFSIVDPTIVEELSLYKNVHLMTNLSDLEYQTQLSNLDILINFRTSYRGETSLTVLEAMRYGCTVIVNGSLGWFAELPDDAVYKVANQREVLHAARSLVASRDTRKMIGENAREYITKVHAPKQYLEIITKAVTENKDSRLQKTSEIIKTNTSLKDVLDKVEKIS